MSNRPTHTTQRSAPSAKQIEEVDAFDQLIAGEERVLVEFTAEWCGPCKVMAPTIDELAAETEAPVVKVDIDTLPGIADRYDIRGVPTVLVMEHETVEERLRGIQEKETLVRAIE